jgi:hypothetical protein
MADPQTARAKGGYSRVGEFNSFPTNWQGVWNMPLNFQLDGELVGPDAVFINWITVKMKVTR